MGDKYGCLRTEAPGVAQPGLQLATSQRVECCEGFVEEQQGTLQQESPKEGDALAHAA